MRKLIHGTIGIARFLLLAGMGVGLLVITLAGAHCDGQDCWAWLLESLQPYRREVMAVGGGIVILELLYLLTRPGARRIPETLSFKSKGGPISVRSDVIRDTIGRIADEFPGVEEMKTVVSRTQGHIDLDLFVRVRAGVPIPSLCNDLQKRAREVVAQHIGLFELRQVRVQIQDLLQPGPPMAEPATPEPPPAQEQSPDRAPPPDSAKESS